LIRSNTQLTSQNKTRPLSGLVLFALAALLTVVLPGRASATPAPFDTTYTGSLYGLKLNIHRTFGQTDSHQQWLLEQSGKAFIGSIKESSRITFDDDTLVPLAYSYEKSVFGSKRKRSVTFNWAQKTALSENRKGTKTLTLTTAVDDKLSYQLNLQQQLQHWYQGDKKQPPPLDFKVADKGKIRDYRFTLLGEEVVTTERGRFNTLKVQRVREDKDRQTTIWFAIDHSFVLLKLQQKEPDGKSYAMELKEGSINGAQITPLPQ